MCVDRKQFIATADGSQVRLFPENYGILERQCSLTHWNLAIDKAVPRELALLIFGEFHTNDTLNWGEKHEVLDILNGLIDAPVEPVDIVEKHADTDWEPEARAKGYHIWRRQQHGKPIYQCTITNCPPQTQAGYGNLSVLLKLKGISL